jgi:hypothetical protein
MRIYTSREDVATVKRVRAQIDRKLVRAVLEYLMQKKGYGKGTYQLLLQPDGSLPAPSQSTPEPGKWRFRFDEVPVNTGGRSASFKVQK